MDTKCAALDLNGLLRLLDGVTEITVFTAAKKQGWIHRQKITTVNATYTIPQGLWSNGQYGHEDVGWSLSDAGIMPGQHNDHLTFETLEEARLHIGLCITCGGATT